MTVEIKSDGSLFDEFFRLKYEIIKKYGVEPRGDIKNATAEKMLIEQAYLKGYVDGKAEAMQWIPCSERLPEEPKENPLFEGAKVELYLVSCGDEFYPFRAFWNGKDFTDGLGKVDVEAWMPLPLAYKEGE